MRSLEGGSRARAPGDPSGASAVDVEGVSCRFGEVVALDRVTLQVAAGEIHGLLGPNGAGKTTLLSILFGLTAPGEGSVRLFGRTQQEAGADWLDRVGGFVEAPSFYPYLSGRANLELLADLDASGGRRMIDELMDLVGLRGAAGERVRGYSLGMRQRLGLAAALLKRPRLLILDEPTNGMDPAGIRELRAGLQALAGAGLAVILSSHDMAQVEEICDSATVLHQGRVVRSSRLEELRSEAPSPGWKLGTTDDDRAAEVAVAVGLTVSRAGGHLSVMADDRQLDEYVERLSAAAIGLRSLVLEVTPLESIFFALTGTDRP